jgi:hypothetical protein
VQRFSVLLEVSFYGDTKMLIDKFCHTIFETCALGATVNHGFTPMC